eukprot:Clim_evm1s105 gene=Clim_evmTU1s105
MAAHSGTIAQSDLLQFDKITKEILQLGADNVEVLQDIQLEKCRSINAELQPLKSSLAHNQADKKTLERKLDELQSSFTKRLGARMKAGGLGAQKRTLESEIGHLQVVCTNQEAEATMLRTDLLEGERIYFDIKKAVSRLEYLKKEEAEMLERIFRGRGGAGDAKENQLEEEVLRIGPLLTAVNANKERYEGARNLLQQANKTCQAALQDVETALRWSEIRLVNRNTSSSYSIGRTTYLRRARAPSQQSTLLYNKARGAVPDLAPMSSASDKQVLAALDAVTDPFRYRDSSHMEIEKSVQLLKQSATAIQDALSWVQLQLNNSINPAMQSFALQYNSTKTHLDAHRRQLMEHALQNGGITYTVAQVQNAYTSSDEAGSVMTVAQRKREEAALHMKDSMNAPPFVGRGGAGTSDGVGSTGTQDPSTPSTSAPPYYMP